jgi:hypothetical protein
MRARPRIGEPCEHFSGCKRASVWAAGWWYPSPGGGVYCDEHLHLGRGDIALGSILDLERGEQEGKL